jgi:hypothetical protein
MNELNKLYKAMLLSWGGVVKDDGRVVYQITDPKGEVSEVPMRIDNLEMYLPLSEVLEGNCNDKVFFHPACENILSKETEVFKLIRRVTVMKLLTTFRVIPAILINVASAKEKKSWKQDVLNMLEPIKNAKKATFVELGRLFARMHVELEEDGLDNRFVHFKVSKGNARSKTDANLRVYYKTKPTFPFYNEIVKRLAHSEGSPDNQMVEINNHSFSRGCLKLAQHVFQVLMPAVLSPDEFEFDSTDPIAARLVSFLGCYVGLAEELNRILSTFRQEFNQAGIYPIDVEWTEHLEELPEIHRQVPTLDYNSHNIHEEVVDNNFGRADMGGLLSVSRQHQPQQHPATLLNQQQPHQGNHIQTMAGDVDVSSPPMEAGDRYIRYEIDYNNNRVLHHAVNTRTNNPVVYECTRAGNMMRRVETQMGGMMGGMNPLQMGMMGMGGMMGGMGMMGMGNQTMLPNGTPVTPMGNGMFMLPNGQLIQGPQGSPSTSSSAAPSGSLMGDFNLY